MSKIAIALVAALTLSACSTVSVSESKSSKNLMNSVDKTWEGEIQNTFDEKTYPYNVVITDIKVEFKEGDLYHDITINMIGDFSIKGSNGYDAKSTVFIELAGSSKVDKNSSQLKVSDLYTKKIEFDNLYNAYSKDIVASLKDSLDDISDLYFNSSNLLTFEGYTKLYNVFNNSKPYHLAKENDGHKIKVLFKEENVDNY